MNAVIQTHSISKKYGKMFAVNNISLTLRQGDIYGLVGRNGAGKSTLFKLLMGLTYPHSGTLDMFGNNSSAGLRAGRSNIGFMIEPNFFTYMNAYDNLNYFRTLKGIQDKSEIERVLQLVDLKGIKKPFKSYSMGMKQRLGIANALLGNPKVIILDEPVNGLDPQGIADFRNLIQKINREFGITILISSHILSELSMLATRFGFIEKGKLIEEISQEELLLKSRTAIKLEVNDSAKTVVLLEETFTNIEYSVISDNLIMITDASIQPHRLSRFLIENGIELSQIYVEKRSLEHYFLDLIGERYHDELS